METHDVLRLAQPPLKRFAPGALLGLASALCAVALLATAAYLITKAAEQPPILYLGMAMVGVRAFALGRAGFRYADRLASHDAAFRTLRDLRVGVFERLVPLAPDGLAGTRRGDLLSRLVGDVDELQNLPLRVVSPLVISGSVAVLSVVTVTLILPAAGLALALTLLMAFALGTWAQTRVAGRAERGLAPLRGAFTDRVIDLLASLDVLIAYGALEERLAGLDEADRRLTAAVTRQSVGVGVTSAVTLLLAGIASVLALVLGIPALGQGDLNGPALAVVVLVPLAVFEVVGMVPLALGAWRQVRSSAERVASAVPDARPAEIPADVPGIGTDRPAGVSLPGPAILELVNVSARWPNAAVDALENVSFTVSAGDRILIEGPSGSGKTTLAHVLVRFLEHSGEYRLGGVDVHSLAPDEVRRIVGLNEQTPYLFDDSIRQNLLFARDTATDADLEAVLQRVGLADWTRSRGGLDAPVGERGALVSGGQAQRLALARSLLADFPVLVLDEPTANVDPEFADSLIRDILDAAAGDFDSRAVIVISHTPVPADLISQRIRLKARVRREAGETGRPAGDARGSTGPGRP